MKFWLLFEIRVFEKWNSSSDSLDIIKSSQIQLSKNKFTLHSYKMKTNIASWIMIDSLWRILLIKRKYDKKEFPNYWSLPGWRVENWEQIESSVIREVKEETWLDFEIQQLYLQQESEYNYFYRFLWSFTGSIIIQEEECDWFGWFTYEETHKLLIYSNIKNIINSLNSEKLIL